MIYIFAMEDSLETCIQKSHIDAIDWLRRKYFEAESYEEMGFDAIVLIHLVEEVEPFRRTLYSTEKFMDRLVEELMINHVAIPAIFRKMCTKMNHEPEEATVEQYFGLKEETKRLSVEIPSELDWGNKSFSVFGSSKENVIYRYACLSQADVECISEDEDLRSLLTQAVKYDNWASAIISRSYFEYLAHVFHITKQDEGHCYYYYKHLEGILFYVQRGKYITILINIKEKPGKLFCEDILKEQNIIKTGLSSFLDPNQGGSLSKEYIEIASEIIFG